MDGRGLFMKCHLISAFSKLLLNRNSPFTEINPFSFPALREVHEAMESRIWDRNIQAR